MTTRFSLLILAVALLGVCVPAPPTDAQSQVTTAVYAPGWNMAGGPPGTTLATADAVYAYVAGGYVPAQPRLTAPCLGVWARFARTVRVSLPDQAPPTGIQVCPLATGWTMVGNPFRAPAELPSQVVAYLWNPATGHYVTTTAIPAGAAVWIAAPARSSVTMRAQSPTPAGTLTITPPFAPEYQVHVGDTIVLLLPDSMTYTARVDPTYLTLVNVGATQSYPATQFWRWRAIATGETDITLDPACRQATPPCGVPSLALRLVIQP